MIKAIVFDCFGVLYLHRGPEFLKSHAPNYPKIRQQLHDLSNQTDYGLISQTDYEQGVVDLTGLPLKEVHNGVLHGFGRNDDLMNYVERTLRHNYSIGMLSNISRGSMEKFFTEHERQKFFDAVALSGETGMIKPSPSAYVHICEMLGIDTSEAIMVDDSAENCRGATLAGMHAIHYDGLPHFKQSLQLLLQKTTN